MTNRDNLVEQVEILGEELDAANQRGEELEAELESLRDDAALGALVRQMPTGWCLWQVPREGVWYWYVDDDEDGPVGYGLTPEAALQEALGEE